MADNETSYLPIGTCLEQIEKAVYGREVRQAIHDGIAQCYDDTVEGVNAAQQAASDTQDVIDNAVAATNRANTAATEASNVKVEQTVSGDTVTFTTTKRDGTTVSTSFQKPNIVVSKDEGSGEFSVTAKGWNGEEIIAKIPDPSEEVKSRATIAAVSKVKTALGNPLTITDGMDAPAVKTVVTLEPKQDLHGYDHPWVGGSGKNKLANNLFADGSSGGIAYSMNQDGSITCSASTAISASARIDIGSMTLASGTYILSGLAANNTKLNLRLRTNISSGSSEIANMLGTQPVTFTLNAETTVYAVIIALTDYTGTDTVYPMICLATETDPTYEPYSNICQIEGYDTVRVTATGKNLYDSSLVVIGKNWLNYNAANRAVFAVKTVKGSSLNVMAVQNGDTHRLVIVGVDKFGSNAQQSFNKNFLSSIATIQHTVTADEYVIVQFERLDGGNITQDDIDCWDIAISYTDINTTSLSVAQAAGATVYGGTVTLNEDGSGTLVVDRASVTLSGLDTNKVSYSPLTKTFYITLNVAPGLAKKDYTAAFTGICDKFEPYPGTPAWSANTKPYIGYGSDLNFRFAIPGKTEVADVLDILNGTTVTYYLATPTTYTLTADQLRTLTGENHVWTDGTKLELTYRADKYADVEKFLNAIPTGTKTGNPAVFADGADDLPFEKLTIAVEPHQEGSGDPSPDNVRPITGWDAVKVTRCGKNLLKVTSPNKTISGITYTINSDGTFYANGTATGNALIWLCPNEDFNKLGLVAGKKYTLGTRINSTAYIYVEDTNNNHIYEARAKDTVEFTYNGETNWRICFLVMNGTTLNNVLVKPMIRLSTENAEFEPYTSTTLPISLKYATGSTVYGGTVTINRDGTGSVVVDRAMIDMGSTTWQYDANYKFFQRGISGRKAGSLKLLTSIYKTGTATGQGAINDKQITSASNSDIVVIRDLSYTDATAFKAAVTGVPLVYELATPTTFTLTAPQLTSLLGNNTVWCDAGQVTVKYKRDIGKMISNLYALMVDTGVIVIENEEDVTVEGPHYNP